METAVKTDRSYGTIPYQLNGGEILFLLLVEARGEHWTFPKGHAEVGETKIETALRELKEETSLVPDTVLQHKTLIQRYICPDRSGKGDVQRIVEFFIVEAQNPCVRLQPEEIAGFRWMSLETILEITPFPELHQNAKEAFEIVSEHIKSGETVERIERAQCA